MDRSEEPFLFAVGACGGKSWADYRRLVCDLFNHRFKPIYESEAEERYCVWLISSVPVSKLPELIHEMKKDLEEIGLVSMVVGQVGDGNFHVMLLFTTEEELEIAQNAAHRIVHRAIGHVCRLSFLYSL